ncbi:YebO family protein [Brenneria tiliae]|uniref:YebO family protein n=1 Tax=Brenneria tiliae TaxID=2914984 RepID=A0ABT0N2D6_9GAMM|nr:YebO family protein [Brenneria tiliae]MCL2895624.1 YebO family protein [Brenneria tiliae]
MSGIGVDTLEMIFIVLVALLAAMVWFFINRASVRANEQIKLLREIAEQQRQQLTLLKMLVPQQASEDSDDLQAQDDVALDFKNVIPER